MPSHQIQDSDITAAVNSCFTCARSCLEAFQYCLDEKGTAFSGKHLSLLQECVDSCQLTARFLVAESSFYQQSCELTYEVSLACARECERYEYDDVFRRAALNCRRCADACRGMMGMVVRVSGEEIVR